MEKKNGRTLGPKPGICPKLRPSCSPLLPPNRADPSAAPSTPLLPSNPQPLNCARWTGQCPNPPPVEPLHTRRTYSPRQTAACCRPRVPQGTSSPTFPAASWLWAPLANSRRLQLSRISFNPPTLSPSTCHPGPLRAPPHTPGSYGGTRCWLLHKSVETGQTADGQPRHGAFRVWFLPAQLKIRITPPGRNFVPGIQRRTSTSTNRAIFQHVRIKTKK